jgi:hypothetical protein
MNHTSTRSRAGSTLLAIGLGLALAPGLVTGPSAYAAPTESATTGAAAQHSRNLIRNPGAERTGGKADPNGKVPVKGWKVATDDRFTAVPYGAPEFPDESSPGPAKRGDNFFAGGTDGSPSIATQKDSLAAWAGVIKRGRARFTLSAWLGGFSSQRDDAAVSITWLNGKGKAVGHAHVGPVSPKQRSSVTGMLYREKAGKVPVAARAVLVKITMRRFDAAYNDGYADDLSLVLSRRKG